ncbi:hypothetical protein [Paeniglutamicibacter gangotriensis]|nr:hypothetical protein [Paeniglutamicibacter gangotriensis]
MACETDNSTLEVNMSDTLDDKDEMENGLRLSLGIEYHGMPA